MPPHQSGALPGPEERASLAVFQGGAETEPWNVSTFGETERFIGQMEEVTFGSSQDSHNKMICADNQLLATFCVEPPHDSQREEPN